MVKLETAVDNHCKISQIFVAAYVDQPGINSFEVQVLYNLITISLKSCLNFNFQISPCQS